MDREDELRADWYRLVQEIEYTMKSNLEDAWVEGLPEQFHFWFKGLQLRVELLANVGNELALRVKQRIEGEETKLYG